MSDLSIKEDKIEFKNHEELEILCGEIKKNSKNFQ
jgi:hypothetical protein